MLCNLCKKVQCEEQLQLTFHLLNFASTTAAEYAAITIGKSDCIIRQWRADFLENQAIPDSQQGRYQRSGVLWLSEALNTKACEGECQCEGMP